MGRLLEQVRRRNVAQRMGQAGEGGRALPRAPRRHPRIPGQLRVRHGRGPRNGAARAHEGIRAPRAVRVARRQHPDAVRRDAVLRPPVERRPDPAGHAVRVLLRPVPALVPAHYGPVEYYDLLIDLFSLVTSREMWLRRLTGRIHPLVKFIHAVQAFGVRTGTSSGSSPGCARGSRGREDGRRSEPP